MRPTAPSSMKTHDMSACQIPPSHDILSTQYCSQHTYICIVALPTVHTAVPIPTVHLSLQYFVLPTEHGTGLPDLGLSLFFGHNRAMRRLKPNPPSPAQSSPAHRAGELTEDESRVLESQVSSLWS